VNGEEKRAKGRFELRENGRSEWERKREQWERNKDWGEEMGELAYMDGGMGKRSIPGLVPSFDFVVSPFL
jgi:DNA-binding PadR family transcriptional regulator